MKLYEIILFLIVFNLLIWVFGTAGYSVLVSGEQTSDTYLQDYLTNFFTMYLASTFILLAAAAVGSYVLPYKPTERSIAYPLLGGFLYSTITSNFSLFATIAKPVPSAVLILDVILIVIYIVVFAFIMQLVFGGWEGFK